jgi:hypothetical protein
MYLEIREAGKNLAEVIVRNAPLGADQYTAIQKVREAVLMANVAIACEDT